MPEFIKNGVVDFGPARVERRGKSAVVTVKNPRFLNAEDDDTLDDTETAADIAHARSMSEICVLRGDVVEHPKYAGRKIFSAGINLTHLYLGKIPYLWYIRRDMGIVNKMLRGLAMGGVSPDEVYGGTREKPWVAGLDVFAIGGGCQYLLVMDYVVAGSDAYMTLPARKEGIIPGAANLRLPRFVGPRIARQAIMMGRRLDCDTPEGRMICDHDRAARRDGAGDRPGGGGLHRLRRGQRRQQPARAARRRGAARRLPPLHGGLCPRAGLLPFLAGADRQSGKALERGAKENLMPGLQLKGVNLAPRREGLEPIETASRDEISALQLERLQWTLAHAYNNVPHYKKAFDKAGVHPGDLKTLADLQKFPFTAKDDLRAQLPLRHVRHAARAGRAHPRLLRHHRQADRGRLQPGAISTCGPR